MRKPRLDRWKEPLHLDSGFSLREGADQALMTELMELQKRRRQSADWAEPERQTFSSFIRSCKEIIFDFEDDRFVFHLIVYTIDAERIDIEIVHLLTSVPEADLEENSKEAIKTLAFSRLEGVPVYPNTKRVEPELLRLHKEMLQGGFEAPDESGKSIRFVLVDRPDIDSPQLLREFSLTETLMPAEIALARNALVDEFEVHERAAATIASIRLATESLRKVLAEPSNEGVLQECLTHNPVLFGPEYIKLVPKHRLGAEFEMDYALIRTSGLADLVEIERSSHALFTRRGNPTQYLAHAEQQVLDWLDWIERHGEYARTRIPGLLTPKGIVVIGRSSALTDSDRKRLIRRNLVFRPTLEILTFDDLLERADALLKFLAQEGLSEGGARGG